MLSDKRNRKKFILEIIASFVLIVFVTALSVWEGRLSDNAKDWVVHTLQAENSLDELFSVLQDAGIGQRGYLLTGDAAYLKRYDEAVVRVPEKISLLKELTITRPEQQENIEELEGLIQQKFDELKKTIELQRDGRHEEALRVVNTDFGKHVMDKIRIKIEEMRTIEDMLFVQRVQRVEELRKLETAGMFASFMLMVLLAFFIVYKIRTGLKNELAEKLQSVMDSTQDGIITTDRAGVIKSVNKSCKALFGKDIIGENIKDFFVFLEDQSEEFSFFDENGMLIEMSGDVDGMKDDGGTFSAALSITSVNVQNENLYCVVVRDITERKKDEAEILRSNEELENFAYIVSHDLQEPLRMIFGFTKLLEEEYQDKKLDGQAQEYMTVIAKSGKNMQNLISGLLEYSRVGHKEDDFEFVESGSIMKSALDNLEEVIHEKKAEIIVGDLPVIWANPVLLGSLFQNLIGNALKYQEEGKTPRIDVNAEERGQEWLFSIKDNGIGIKPDCIDQVFIIFKRVHSGEGYQGTGLGLTMCKKIVETFGGKIWVESEYGSGSTFYFTVPQNVPHQDKIAA